MILKKTTRRALVPVGLVLLATALMLRSLGPQWFHSDAGDGALGFLIGVGLTLELIGVLELRRGRGAG